MASPPSAYTPQPLSPTSHARPIRFLPCNAFPKQAWGRVGFVLLLRPVSFSLIFCSFDFLLFFSPSSQHAQITQTRQQPAICKPHKSRKNLLKRHSSAPLGFSYTEFERRTMQVDF